MHGRERGSPVAQAESPAGGIMLVMAADEAEESNQSLRPVQGQLSYLQIPARNVQRSAEFYARVFGWHIEHPHPGFDAPGLIGQWVTDRPPARDAGMLPWLHVDSMEDAMKLVRAHGGEVLEHPTPDGPDRLLATVRDPAGNVVGLVQLVTR
jgi:predicted enzyme related to lactoylglutathione lyase